MLPDSIAHYKILRKLGEGGMGEVFLASDERLHRSVALKILPERFAKDKHRMARFQQEARIACTVSHPSITQIFDVGEEDGTHYIVMEFVEGQTLDDRLSVQSLSTAEIVRLALHIAEGLEAAHKKGITHRDIKPSNIMIASGDRVKVLDFGLAKEPESEILRSSKATTHLRTEPGVLVGTVQYMSPEQLLGAEVDHRTDIFSFGMVLYEMATGKRPFEGPTTAAIIHNILQCTPAPISAIRPGMPAELDRLIRKCLRRLPSERYQGFGDILVDLHVLEKEVSGISNDRFSLVGDAEFRLPRTLGRMLFLLLQFVYLFFYIATLRWTDGVTAGFRTIFSSDTATIVTLCYVITAIVGIAVRLHLISLTAFDHITTGVQFRKMFPIIFLLDSFWAFIPFSLSLRTSPIFLLACVPPLAFSPFSQRTLIRSAYDLQIPRRRSTISRD